MAVGDDSEALWRAVQEAVDEHLDAEGNPHLAQLGIEYVEAMRSGARLRELAEEKPFSVLKSGRIVSNPLWEAADRDIRRGIQLAKALELNRPRPAREADPFARLDAELGPVSPLRPVNLASRRNKRTKGGAA
jgi:hypothetical protein